MGHDGTAVKARAPGRRRLTPRRVPAGPIGAVMLGVVVLALLLASAFLSRSAHLGGATGGGAISIAVASLAVGVLLAMRRPDNAMGWCLLAASFFLGCSGVGGSLSVLDYRLHHGVPLGGVGVLLQPGWAPAIVFFGLSFLLFPDGHFSARTVKWATWIVLAVGVVWMTGAFAIAIQALTTHTVRLDHTANLLAIDHPRGSWAWWGTVQDVFFVVLGASWVLWIVQQVPRYRRAGEEERHQMKWLLSGAAVALVCGFATFTHWGPAWVSEVGLNGLVVLPVSIAVGATKFHLYAIDRLISRTIAYVALTGVVVGTYVGVVTLATKVIGFSSPVGVAASTLVAAALFNPVRRRLQSVIDRRFNRARYDAERTVSDFSSRLRESVVPGSVGSDLIEVVNAVFEPDSAAMWIRREPGRAAG